MGKMTTHHALLPNPEITTHKCRCDELLHLRGSLRMLTHAALVYAGILGTKVQKNEGRC